MSCIMNMHHVMSCALVGCERRNDSRGNLAVTVVCLLWDLKRSINVVSPEIVVVATGNIVYPTGSYTK